MSKNLTLKGAAFGALVALSISAVAPASAAGLADTSFVSLAPTTGTAYTVVAGAGKTFSLTANEASSVAGTGRNVKFLVTDSAKTVDVATTSTGLGADTFDAATDDTIARDAAGLVTITDTGDASVDFAAGDRVKLVTDIVTATGDDVAAGFYTIVSATSATNSTFTFQTDVLTANTAQVLVADDDIEFAHAAWDSSNSFVVNSGVADSATDETLVLTVGGTTTRTVDVTAWVDANADGDIDSTEYVSPTRTVTFKKGSEITATTNLVQPALGDASVVAKVTTTPELNGSQMSNNDVVAKFTKQGSTATLAPTDTANNTVWNSTDKVWVATVAMNDADWTGSSATTVIAGTYSARPYIGSDALAAAVSATVGSTQADDVKATIAASADAAAASNEDASSGTAATVRTGKSVTVTAKIYDNASTPALVGAGIPVTATLSGVTGTIKVDGSASSSTLTTNASGEVSFVVTTTTALASDAAALTIQAQNVSTNTKQAKFTIDWQDAVATLYDSSVANGAEDVNRTTTATGGSVTYKFAILDQFKQALSGTYRLKVANTGRTVQTSYAAVTAGAAEVTVADGGIGSGTTISTAVDVEKDVSGTWTAQDLYNDGDANGSADTVTYTTNLVTQTDAVTLDADGASTYGSGTADDVDALAAAATVALDSRSSLITVPTYTNAVTVTGRVANATTAAVRAGAKVTISGDASFLFANDGVYSFGSITVLTDASGEFSVDVYSTKAAADSVITVASNGASATRKVTFSYPTTANKDSKLTITGADSTTPGRTANYVIALTDKYCNAIKGAIAISVVQTGSGYLSTTPTAVSATDGKAAFTLITGANDTGSTTITVTYDVASPDADVVATKTVTIGAAPVVATAAASGSTAKIYASATNAAGKTVVVKVNGKTVKSFAGTAAKKTVVVAATAGAKNVSVFVGGVKVLGKVVTVK